MLPQALFQWCCGSKLHHYGDYVDPNETTIIVLNHRTRVDWNYVWIALYHATQKPYKNIECLCKGKFVDKPPDVKSDILDVMARGKSKIKFVLKDEIKNIPGMGKLKPCDNDIRKKTIVCFVIAISREGEFV